MTAFIDSVIERLQDLNWVIIYLLAACAWIFLCHKATDFHRKRLSISMEFMLLFAALAAGNVLVTLLLPESISRIAMNIASGIVGFLYLFVYLGYRGKGGLVMWCSLFAGMCCIFPISALVSHVALSLTGSALAELLGRSLVFSLVIVVAFFLRRVDLDEYRNVPASGLALILVGDIAISLLTILESILWPQTEIKVAISHMATYVCIFTMVCMAIYAMYTMCREQDKMLALQTEKQRLQSEQELMRATESNLEDLRCIRHDLKSQYGYMKIMLERGQYEELGQYFDQMVDNLPRQLNYVDCGNSTMNTILNMEFSKAKNAQIAIQHRLVVPPVLPFSSGDLLAILANLMDNAIEECSRLREKGVDGVGVWIEINPYMNYLYIMCSNTTDRDHLSLWKDGLRTTKEDAQLHGYGTQIVAKLAEKYDGHVEYKLKERRFVAQVLLDMMKENTV